MQRITLRLRYMIRSSTLSNNNMNNKQEKIMEILLQESYILVYKLVVMGLIAVEYIRVGRTGVNAYSIRKKL